MDIISNRKLYTVIGASSLGTLIEWYDFYIFGSLATIISEKFFRQVIQRLRFLPHWQRLQRALLCGHSALCFGRLGDLIGRKHTFLLTLIIMGGSTFLIGLVPSYESFHLRLQLYFYCVCFKGLHWVANMVALQLMLPSMHRQTAAVILPAGFRQPPRWVYSSPLL